MAIVNKGFPGTVNATEYAKSWHLGGADGCDGTGWLTTQGTGRQASTAAGDAFAAGILSTNSAPILTSIPTPVAGQWFLIVRRIDWAGAGTVTVAAVAHTTTTTTVPASPPGSYPTINNAPGSLYDQKLGWAWARNTDTIMAFFDLRKKPLESRLTDSETLAIQTRDAVIVLEGGAGRSTGAVYPTATPATLDAIANAVVGDIAQVTLPGTGVEPIQFRAVAGSGTGIDWRLNTPIYADTKANLDTATTTLTGISDVIFRIGDTAYAADTAVTYRWNGTAWKAWASDWISYTPTFVNFTVGTGGSATSTAEYKYSAGRVHIRHKQILGTSGASVGTGVSMTVPVAAVVPTARFRWLTGNASLYDVSAAGISVLGQYRHDTLSATVIMIVLVTNFSSVANISATAPYTWAAGDELTGEFSYDPA